MMIRPATMNDAPGVAAVQVASWNTTYRGLIHDDFIDARTVEERTARWTGVLTTAQPGTRTFVALNDAGTIVGFATVGPAREVEYGYDGELYALYLIKEEQGRGVGTALMTEAMAYLREQGHARMLVWVLSTNPNRAFYRARGGTEAAHKQISFDGVSYDETGFGWELA